MITSTYNNGLRIEIITPNNGELDISVNTQITLKFNSELDISSIMNSFIVFEDTSSIYSSSVPLKDQVKFLNAVVGSIAYREMSLIFTPSQELKKNTRYLICVKANGLRDILGSTVLKEEMFTFFTHGLDVQDKIEIIIPKNNSIIKSIDEIELTETSTKLYFVQISKVNTFETILVDKTYNCNSNIIPTSFGLEEGMYYMRAKSDNGEWSDITQFFIKPQEEGLVSQDDIKHLISQIEAEEDNIELLEIYPTNEQDMITLKLGVIYFKFSGKVSLEDVDFSNTYIYGDYVNEEDADTITINDLNGEWTSVYDSTNNVSYIIFSLK